MKKNEFNESLNHIPMDLIENFTFMHENLIRKSSRRKTIERIVVAAACICIIASSVLISLPIIMSFHNEENEYKEVNKPSDDNGILPPTGSGNTGDEGKENPNGQQTNRTKTMYMTVAETRPGCLAIERSHPDYGTCFFAYGEDNNFYCIPWDNVDKLTEKAYVKLTYSGIKEIEYPEGKPDGGYTPDYLMTATKVEIKCDESLDHDYGKLISFATAVWEYEAKDYNSTTNIEVSLLDYEMNYLSIRCNDLSAWTDDRVVNRELFHFSGRVRVAAGDTVDWLYYGYRNPLSSIFVEGILYYNGYFTNMNEQDANLFSRIVPTHPDDEMDPDWIAFTSGEVLSQILLSENDEQSILSIMHSDAKWIYEIPECDWIGIFTGPDIHIRYCDCGTIADLFNDRSRKLTDEEKAIIELLIKRYNLAGNYNKFSYSDELAKYPAGTPGVKYDGFSNTTEMAIYFDTDALERAQNECTITWDTSKVYYDVTADTWKVLFYSEEYPGGDQSVYLSGKGITLLIVYGE